LTSRSILKVIGAAFSAIGSGLRRAESSTSSRRVYVMYRASRHKTDWLPQDLPRDGRDLPSWSRKRPPFLLETSLQGVFCAGDVRHDSIKRVSSGVGEGSMAIAFVYLYLALPGTP
jgi:thioredoxin reductase